MAWVYILRGASERHYFGATDHLNQRISEHQRGSNHTTRRFGGPIRLLASREVASMEEARALEKLLKKMKNPAKAIRFLNSNV
jgi:predicted GIY-YIG superfamily endonuclease